MRRTDPKTFLKGALGRDKCIAWSKPVNLNSIKQLSKAAGCTINDLFLALTSGAACRFMERHDENTGNMNLRLAVTVNLKTGAKAENWAISPEWSSPHCRSALKILMSVLQLSKSA